MIKRQYLQPKDMWARVENGNLLYVPVITIHGADHAHVYLSGQIAAPGEDVAVQTEAVLNAIDTLLQEAGSDRAHLLQATIWLLSGSVMTSGRSFSVTSTRASLPWWRTRKFERPLS